MKTIWKFSLGIDATSKLHPHAIGIDCDNLDDMSRLASLVGRTEELKIPCAVDIAEPEGSARLLALLAAIKEIWGFEPSNHTVIPPSQRGKMFGVKKERTYTKSELDACEWLTLVRLPTVIAKRTSGCDEPSSGDLVMSATNFNPQKKVLIGTLAPFAVNAISGEMKKSLEDLSIKALAPTPVAGTREGLWRLASSVVLPRSLTPLQDHFGEVTDADDWTGKPACKFWDDQGYLPPELVYKRDQIEKLPPFDIAFTYERLGNGPRIAFRNTIVSQHFRQVLSELNVRNVGYAPVRVA